MNEKSYVIVSDYHRIEDLENHVNDLIEKGYKPQGGLSIGEHGYFYQAMFKNFLKRDYE